MGICRVQSNVSTEDTEDLPRRVRGLPQARTP